MYRHDHIPEAFTVRASGNVGQEILDGDGKVVCWTTCEAMAAVIVYLLNQAHEEGGLPI